MKRLWGTAAAVLLALGATFPANAASTTLSYANITNTTSGFNATGQLSTIVDQGVGNSVTFKFLNDAAFPGNGSITDIYFSDNFLTPLSKLFSTTVSQSQITDSGAGVDFSWGSSPPQLPGQGNANPPFNTTLALTADSNSPVGPNGVNSASEWLMISLNLLTGKTFSDVLDALTSGALRIGLHVQQIAGGSDSFVSNPPSAVPLPAALPLFGSALAGIALLRLRRSRKSVS